MTVQDLQKYLRKYPPPAKVVLNVNDDEGLMYSELRMGGLYTGRKGLYCTLVEDPNNKNLTE